MTTKNRQGHSAHSVPNAGYPHHYQTYLPQYHQQLHHPPSSTPNEISFDNELAPKPATRWINSTEEQTVFLLATLAIIYVASENHFLKAITLVVGIVRAIPLKTVRPTYAYIFWFLGYAAWLSHLIVSLYILWNV